MIIKTKRSKIRILIDIVLTALCWLFFLYLFIEGILSIIKGDVPGIKVPFVQRFLPSINTLLIYLFVAFCISFVLLAWASYNALRFGRRERRKAPPPLIQSRLAASFHLPEAQLTAIQQSRHLHIHHTPEGLITRVQADKNIIHIQENNA